MNRSEQLHHVAFLEALAADATRRATEMRERLQAQAIDEYKASGVAGSGRVPGLGAVSLPLAKARFVVESEKALTDWVADVHPEQIEPKIRPAFLRVLLASLIYEDGVVLHNDGAGMVPGVRFEEGGQPKSLQLRLDADAKAGMADLARQSLNALLQVEPEPADSPIEPTRGGEVAGGEAE